MIDCNGYTLISESRSGRVYLSKSLNSIVKVIRARAANEAVIGEMLSADDKNIVKQLEYKEKNARIYIKLEYCAGGDLFYKLENEGAMAPDVVRKYIRQLVNAVRHIHNLGIFHRDISLENIFIDSNGDCKLGDFGSAIFATDKKRIGEYAGKIHYCAPEIVSGASKFTSAADIYSMGICMFAMLLKFFPFNVARKDDERYCVFVEYGLDVMIKCFGINYDNHEAIDLIGSMITLKQDERISLDDIEAHPFMSMC